MKPAHALMFPGTNTKLSPLNEHYECATCGKQYYLRQGLVRHIRLCMSPLSSGVVRSNQSYECASCEKKFNQRQTLVRHVRSCTQCITKELFQSNKSFNCAKCSQRCNRRQDLIRHIRTVHSSQHYLCEVCKKIFTLKETLKRHVQTVHQKIFVSKNTCGVCSKSFSRKDSLMRHMLHCPCRRNAVANYECANCNTSFKMKTDLRVHIKQEHMAQRTMAVKNDNLICVLCETKFSKSKDILQHIINLHEIEVMHEHFQFAALSDFNAWKATLQKNTTSVFIKVRGVKIGRNYAVTRFRCHRSGSFKPTVEKRIRKIKFQGSMKIGGYCPAEITVFQNKENGSCKVAYVRTHLGHNTCDEAELIHMFLPKEEKDELADEIKLLKLNELRKSHEKIIKFDVLITVNNVDDPFVGWLVSVSGKNDEMLSMYAVRQKEIECSGCELFCEECDACIHTYECNCQDNGGMSSMCAHIHGLCLYLKQNDLGISADDLSCQNIFNDNLKSNEVSNLFCTQVE